MSRERAVFSGLLAHDGPLGEMEIVNLVQDGLPVKVIELFINEGITQQEVYGLVAPRRTLTHRRAKSEPLSASEPDRAVRLARVLAQVESVFDSKEKAMNLSRTSRNQAFDMDEQDLQDKTPVPNPVNPVHPCLSSAAWKSAPALDLRYILLINCEDLTGRD